MSTKVKKIARAGRSTPVKPQVSTMALAGDDGSGQFLPSGMGLIELALHAGFVVPVLMDRGETCEESAKAVCHGRAK